MLMPSCSRKFGTRHPGAARTSELPFYHGDTEWMIKVSGFEIPKDERDLKDLND